MAEIDLVAMLYMMVCMVVVLIPVDHRLAARHFHSDHPADSRVVDFNVRITLYCIDPWSSQEHPGEIII